jgi:UDP-N-acetylglucosamine 2-epimerase (non-hydrolysing)
LFVNKDDIMIIAGTRPEVIKIAPVIWWLDRQGVNYNFVWSGQHYDYEMSQIFFEQLRIPKPVDYLEVGIQAQNTAQQVALLIQKIVSVVKKRKPKFIYSIGDTNTVLASALASVYTATPFIHDEAGMRSFDDSMIEEANRKMADAIANFRFAPTKIAVSNLLHEGIPSPTIRLVGSTAVDSLLYVISHNFLKEEMFSIYNVDASRYLLFTIHRRENLAERRLRGIISLLVEIARKLPDYIIIFPVHPHTKKHMERMRIVEKLNIYDNIRLVEPLGYFEFITLLKDSRVVVTDSGGVQEEAFILGRRTVTLRKTTEWPETVILGYNYLVDPDDVRKAENIVVKSVELQELRPQQLSTCPLGDGNAGRRIAKLLQLLSEVKMERGPEPRRYPLMHSTTKIYDLTSASKNGPLIIPRKSKYLKKIFIKQRSLVRDRDILKLIKVDWRNIDKSIECL